MSLGYLADQHCPLLAQLGALLHVSWERNPLGHIVPDKLSKVGLCLGVGNTCYG